jgi:hypothetical protein
MTKDDLANKGWLQDRDNPNIWRHTTNITLHKDGAQVILTPVKGAASPVKQGNKKAKTIGEAVLMLAGSGKK